MNSEDLAKIEQSVRLLQEVLGQKKQTLVAIPSTQDFDDKLLNFVRLGEKLEPDIAQLVASS